MGAQSNVLRACFPTGWHSAAALSVLLIPLMSTLAKEDYRAASESDENDLKRINGNMSFTVVIFKNSNLQVYILITFVTVPQVLHGTLSLCLQAALTRWFRPSYLQTIEILCSQPQKVSRSLVWCRPVPHKCQHTAGGIGQLL